MALETMEDLLVHELRDLYSAEKQLTKALPKLAKAATNDALIQALSNHLEETKDHVSRLEECFALLGASSRGKKCVAMEGLIKEGSEVLAEASDESVCDAAIISSAQRAEHYEISAYGSARAFALRVGQDDVADLLSATLEEESAADELLSTIAEAQVNIEAPVELPDTVEQRAGTAAAHRSGNGNGRVRQPNGKQRGSAIKPSTAANRARSTASRQPPRRGLTTH
jgi:ferritin-like metal-binding protein YciE